MATLAADPLNAFSLPAGQLSAGGADWMNKPVSTGVSMLESSQKHDSNVYLSFRLPSWLWSLMGV